MNTLVESVKRVIALPDSKQKQEALAAILAILNYKNFKVKHG